MKYPTNEDEIAKRAIMDFVTDLQDGDAEAARDHAKLSLAVLELWERGFKWTDI